MLSVMQEAAVRGIVHKVIQKSRPYTKQAQAQPWYQDVDGQGSPYPTEALPDMGDTAEAPVGDFGQDAGSSSENLKAEVFGNTDGGGTVQDAIMNIYGAVKTLAKALYNIDLTEEDALKIVKEDLKTLSGRIADVPVQSFVDAIDAYKQESKSNAGSEQEAPPGAQPTPPQATPPQPPPPPTTPAPPVEDGGGMPKMGRNMQKDKRTPPWER